MAKQITLDVETKNIFFLFLNETKKLGISYVGLHDSETNEYFGYFEKDLGKMWPLLESADLLIGYNIKSFDYEVLAPYYRGDLKKFPTIDLLEIVKDILGFRLKLDNLAKATLNRGKIGDGLDAVRYFREGKLEKLAEYCLEDVRITREIFDYAMNNGRLKYPDLGGVIKEFAVDLEKYLPTSTNDTQMSLAL